MVHKGGATEALRLPLRGTGYGFILFLLNEVRERRREEEEEEEEEGCV